jgi:hypothetical protein
MTQETVTALSDGELSQVVAWGQEKLEARAEKRKQETFTQIRQLAGANRCFRFDRWRERTAREPRVGTGRKTEGRLSRATPPQA